MYSPRVELAVIRMLQAHGLRVRKAGEGFEASHAVSVAMLVHDFGFDEDTVVAALLHDALEDTSLDPASIRQDFGGQVLAIVEDVTEPSKELPWAARKAAYIERLRHTARNEARAIASADKIHNMSRMVEGARAHDPEYWGRFNASVEEIVRYQQDVLQMLRDTWSHPILDRHEHVLQKFLAEVMRTA